jgi:hypothetical protein
MKTGLLWYDNDPKRGLEEKVGRAARRHREKYGRWPNTCFVHSQEMDAHGEDATLAFRLDSQKSVRVLTAPNILLHHYWLGISTKNGDEKQGQEPH